METTLTLTEDELKQAIIEWLAKKGYKVLQSLVKLDKDYYDPDIRIYTTRDERAPDILSYYAKVVVETKGSER